MINFPNAKINIGLFVTEKREDGYHNLETIFYPLNGLKDALEIVPSEECVDSSIKISGRVVNGNNDDNLVWKVYLLLKEIYPNKISNIQIHLLKVIPMGAGLGGGSADAAFMLHLMNQFFALELSHEELARLALQLGSDCPFFVYNSPQYAQGRGEVFTPIALDLSAYSIEVVYPKLHVSTKGAFGKITPSPASFDLKNIGSLDIYKWKHHIANDFEKAIFDYYPVLAEIKNNLYKSNAIFASMSGSGSALFGIFEKGKRSVFKTNEQMEVYYFE